MTALENAEIFPRLRKCRFFERDDEYLGHIVEPSELLINPKSTAEIAEAKPLYTRTPSRSFFGYGERPWKKSSQISPTFLHSALQKEPQKLPALSNEQLAAFEELKNSLVSPTVLKLLRPGLRHTLDTDAFGTKIGCTLLRTYEDAIRYSIGYWSRFLNETEKKYSRTEAEGPAIVWASQILRTYLERERFTINEEHSSIRWLMEITEPTDRLARWLLHILESDSDIRYAKKSIISQTA